MTEENGITKSHADHTDQRKKRSKKKQLSRFPSVGTCFVLMPFKDPFNSYFSLVIEPAVVDAGLEPLRGDSLFRPSPIMADIWQMIQDAKVLVAELTTKNANVFYELGLAHAIGKPVVLITETMDDVPFDLQPLRVILYDRADPAWGKALRGTLASYLRETLRDTTKAVPPMFRKVVKSQAPEDSDLSIRLAELERRVASIPLAARPSVELPNVNWESVMNHLKKGVPQRVTEFRTREHAIAWAMNALIDQRLAHVEALLSQQKIHPNEILRILYFAEHAPFSAESVRRR